MMQRRPVRKGPRLSRNGWLLLLIVALLGTSIWVLTTSGSSALGRDMDHLGLRLGLDLKGGTHLVYRGQFSDNVSDDEKDFKMDGAAKSIESRINRYGVVEPVIQRQGVERIVIQLPGITDLDEARSLIEETAFLEFREVEVKTGSTPATLDDYLSDNRSDFYNGDVAGTRIFAFPATTDESQMPVVILTKTEGGLQWTDINGDPVDPTALDDELKQSYSWIPAVGDEDIPLTGAYLTKAVPQYDQTQTGITEVKVGIEWNGEGAKIFDQIAARLYPRSGVLKELGIFVDMELISSPTIQQSKYEGSAVIEGDFTPKEARLLAIRLDSGALPVPLETLYSKEVSATLGEEFVDRAVLAGVIALGLIILFMMLYYRLPGLVAGLALLIYLAMVLAIYKAVPVTLSLAGLAGFIVSLGMAVDANVLIFERMKEELRAGRTLKAAVDTGFSRAWPAIRDSNITTFIACGILYWFGSSIVDSSTVMGFALTLFFGVAISMFTALVVTRTLLVALAGVKAARRALLLGAEARSV
ncbi:MAG: protein translocase subunit SecD [Chloroflexi bacterium]|nr:protein translocase subunit SecD [Chloroflexota bacterium]